MIEKLAQWLIFSVVIALAPIIYNALSLGIRGKEQAMWSVIERGELLIFICALCATTVGELTFSGSLSQPAMGFAVGSQIFILLICSLIYGDISSVRHEQKVALNVLIVRRASLALFVFALASSAGCVMLVHN